MVRQKHRYFLAEVVYSDRRQRQQGVNTQQVYTSIHDALRQAYGDYGLGVLRSSVMVKYLNPETNMVIVRARRDFCCMAQTALTFVKKIGDHEAFLHTLHVGGTIRACQKFLIQHHRRHLPLLYQQCATQEEREGVQQALLSACINMERFSSKTEDKERSVAQIAGDLGT